ncbi:LysR family transcriptional regulator [Streptomyces sp. A7024]|uniref:LysR family transcriptional regulator n=1 Tax=Streptomyces coryli TaxID=1128680 RepID=A0A6G4U8E4_9ACTN|nr:LysR family transcriptional regulator [Streptomyces coryli]NGN67976.1 LysR family transcriptional regulator [Streptomyces coryli]
MLERHEIEAFLTLAEELHFGRTAERLHVSTARVSQTIAKLERRVGVALFQRTSRRVELTLVGRQLRDEMGPAWAQLTGAVERALEAGRGLTGSITVAFVAAAGGQLLAGAAEEFRKRYPECEVVLRESQWTEIVDWLQDGTVDIGLATRPFGAEGITEGEVLVSEARLLAVSVDHPFARRNSVGLEDLARTPMIQLPETLPPAVRAHRTPATTPSGRPIEPGPTAATFNELITLVGAGRGVFPVGAQVRRYYPRPDVVYVPFSDAPPLEWVLLWRTKGDGERVRAFVRAAHDLVEAAR